MLMSTEDLEALEVAVDGMVTSQAWKDTIAERQWTDSTSQPPSSRPFSLRTVW